MNASQFNWPLLYPEIILTAGGVVLLLLDAIAPKLRRAFTVLAILTAVASAACAVYCLPAGPVSDPAGTFGGLIGPIPTTLAFSLLLLLIVTPGSVLLGQEPSHPAASTAQPAGAAAPAGRAATGAAAFGGAMGRCTTRGAGVVGSGWVGVVGFCCSMRSRSVGGTSRPGTGSFAAGAGTSHPARLKASTMQSRRLR